MGWGNDSNSTIHGPHQVPVERADSAVLHGAAVSFSERMSIYENTYAQCIALGKREAFAAFRAREALAQFDADSGHTGKGMDSGGPQSHPGITRLE